MFYHLKLLMESHNIGQKLTDLRKYKHGTCYKIKLSYNVRNTNMAPAIKLSLATMCFLLRARCSAKHAANGCEGFRVHAALITWQSLLSLFFELPTYMLHTNEHYGINFAVHRLLAYWDTNV